MLLNFYSDSVISSSGFMAEYKTYRESNDTETAEGSGGKRG